MIEEAEVEETVVEERVEEANIVLQSYSGKGGIGERCDDWKEQWYKRQRR